MTNPWKREVILGDGQVRLLLGDCREILPTLGKVDAVVTDPPYGLGDKWAGGGGGKRSSWNFDPSEAQSWDGHTVEGVEALIDAAPEVIIGAAITTRSHRPAVGWFGIRGNLIRGQRANVSLLGRIWIAPFVLSACVRPSRMTKCGRRCTRRKSLFHY